MELDCFTTTPIMGADTTTPVLTITEAVTAGSCFPTFAPPKPLPTVTETATVGGLVDEFSKTLTLTTAPETVTETETITTATATETEIETPIEWTVTSTASEPIPCKETHVPDIFYTSVNPYHSRFPETVQKIVEDVATKDKQQKYRTFVKEAVQIVPQKSLAQETSTRRARLRMKLARRSLNQK